MNAYENANKYYNELEEQERLRDEKMKSNVALHILLDMPLTPEMQEWYDAHFSEVLYDMSHKLARAYYRLGGTEENLKHLKELNSRKEN